MATTYATIEVYLMVDEDGDYGVGKDREGATANYDDDIGEQPESGKRYVRLSVKVPLPTAIELAGEVTVDESGSELKASA